MIKLSEQQIEVIKPLIGRYLLYGVGLLDVLLLPKLLPPLVYGEFEYIKNLIFLFPNALLGIYSGYIYIKYVKQIDTFDTIARIGVIHTIVLSLIVGLVMNNLFIIIPLVIINLYTLIEQKLKVEKYFITIFSYKPLLSVAIVLLASGIIRPKEYNANQLIFGSFALSFGVWMLLVRQTKVKIMPRMDPVTQYEIKKYIYIIKKIISSVLVSTILSLFFFSERYFVEKYYAEGIGVYSFGYNLCQVMIVLINSLAYISTVQWGEQVHELIYSKVLRSLQRVLLGYSILFVLFIILVFLISPFYQEFTSLPFNVMLISFSKGLYYAVGILTPILVYKDFNNQMFLASLLLLMFSFALNFYLISIQISFSVLLLVNNTCLIIYTVYVIYLLLRRVQYQ
ncbi:MAG: hypothetical protein EAZ67_10980 [Cytophagales bacterium]|nr:MAG: hypothetical protein EAZ67_10980 [Cytophagales bacterium]